MSNTKTFHNITQSIWNCVQQTSTKEHGTIYDPPYPSNQGTSTTNTAVGKVVVDYDFEPSSETVTYTIKHKPFVVTDGEIWGGIESTIKQCSSS
jgi:hypothetical protein